MDRKNLLTGALVFVMSGLTVKVFKTIIDEYKKKDEMVIEDEIRDEETIEG